MLAINGGVPVINSKFKPYNTIGAEEIDAVVEVLRTGSLSKFIGAWCDDFYGGPQVQALEFEWKEYFGVKNAIAVNSWTSGLTAAIGAIGNYTVSTFNVSFKIATVVIKHRNCSFISHLRLVNCLILMC